MSAKLGNFTMPLVFLGVLLFSFTCSSLIPQGIKSILYGASLSIKNALIFCLPFVIFSLVFSSISRLGAKAVKYIIVILPLVCCSNFMNTMLSYIMTSNFLNFNIEAANSTVTDPLMPAFELSIKGIISNDCALLSGVIGGLLLGIMKPGLAEKISKGLGDFTQIFFKGLLPIMPFFIIGTILKLDADGVLGQIFKQYLPVLILFIISAYGLVTMEFLILSRFNMKKLMGYIRNLCPAVITAFGAMSSAAALPLSIKAAEENAKDKASAGIIVPSTVNIHLVGDCFFIPMTAMAALVSFNIGLPSIGTYIPFALHFVLAKFAVAAIPGGGVLVMLPVMQNYLGLNSDMLALVTALYILFDPFITTCNVAGNNALAMIFDRLVAPRSKKLA